MKRRKIIFITTFLVLLLLCVFTAVLSSTGASITHKLLAAGSPEQVTLTIIKGKAPGTCIFVVGGIHGDERAGWLAAEKLRRQAKITAGTLYILSPANAWGAQNDMRLLPDNWDLNRIFPGKADGDAGQRLAYEIYEAVKQAKPALLLDLHEAQGQRVNRDDLGGSVVFTSMNGMEAFVLELLEQTRQGVLCSTPLTYYSSSPKGSLNREVTLGLNVPALTIETSRVAPEKERISDQLDIVHFALRYYALEK